MEFFGGFDKAVTPFIKSPRRSRLSNRDMPEFLPREDSGMEIIPQLIESDADYFVFIANWFGEQGYSCVNWNTGCPSRPVMNRKRGAGILPYPDIIDAVLEKVFKEIKIDFSIKMRLGMESPEDIFKVIPVLNRYPLKEIIIHPRVGIDGYGGKVNLDIFEEALELIERPVIYNGDIFSVEDIKKLEKRFPKVSGWMIARGAAMDPFLPLKIKGESVPENRVEIIFQFIDKMFSIYRKEIEKDIFLLGRMKEIWFYFSNQFENSEDLYLKLRRVQTIDAYHKVVESLKK